MLHSVPIGGDANRKLKSYTNSSHSEISFPNQLFSHVTTLRKGIDAISCDALNDSVALSCSFALKASINFGDAWWFPAKHPGGGGGYFLHMYILLARFSNAFPFRNRTMIPSIMRIDNGPIQKSIHQIVRDIALWFFSPFFPFSQSIGLSISGSQFTHSYLLPHTSRVDWCPV